MLRCLSYVEGQYYYQELVAIADWRKRSLTSKIAQLHAHASSSSRTPCQARLCFCSVAQGPQDPTYADAQKVVVMLHLMTALLRCRYQPTLSRWA